jgi:hypothetical protein
MRGKARRAKQLTQVKGKSECADFFLAFFPFTFRCPAPSPQRFYASLPPLNVYALSHGSVKRVIGIKTGQVRKHENADFEQERAVEAEP